MVDEAIFITKQSEAKYTFETIFGTLTQKSRQAVGSIRIRYTISYLPDHVDPQIRDENSLYRVIRIDQL